MGSVDIRCPVGPKRLLFKLRLAGEKPEYVEGNLIELTCDDCRRRFRKNDPKVARVLHRYNFIGDLIETIVL